MQSSASRVPQCSNRHVSPLRRFARGCVSLVVTLVFPLGRFCRGAWCEPERLDRGYVLILPGIEGKSFFNVSVAWGLLDAGVESAIEIFDWTTGWTVLALYHLRSTRRHEIQAHAVAQKIIQYQREHPGRPVHLIGHSGGGGVAILTLELLPADCRVERAILLAPAVSAEYRIDKALSGTRSGMVNFWSRFDVAFLAIGTWLFGTFDGRHCVAAGCRGFQPSKSTPAAKLGDDSARLIQHPYRREMIQQFHLGGHFGWTNRVFAAERIAPLLQTTER